MHACTSNGKRETGQKVMKRMCGRAAKVALGNGNGNGNENAILCYAMYVCEVVGMSVYVCT